MLKFFEWLEENIPIKPLRAKRQDGLRAMVSFVDEMHYYKNDKGETSMAKFKVGDKVRVKKDLVGGTYIPRSTEDVLYFSHNMEQYKGKVYTVKYIYSNGDYILDDDTDGYLFCDGMLDLVERGFCKQELKDGMVVETREPAHVNRYLVLGKHFIQERGTLDFCFYNDDLTRNDRCGTKNDVYDIVKVYKAIAIDLHDIFKDACLELIWERPEEEAHKEMTVEEIEKELGYKIKVVGGQNG